MKNSYFKHLFTALILLCSTVVFAENVIVDSITYELIAKGKQAKVIAGETRYAGDIVIPTSVEHNGVTYSVTSIGEDAFHSCSGLTSVVIPNSVTSIGVQAFNGCFALKSIVIPNSVTSIGDNAFIGCSALTSIVIPNSVTSIGDYVFYNCSGLTMVEIPNSVTSIGWYAFRGCSALKSIVIPNSVTSIGWGAFEDCSGLTSIEIPNSVTSIGSYAFSGCSALTSIEIPNSVTSIGEYAFYDCTSLTTVIIGSGVEYIYDRVFAKCSNLVDVYCFATEVPYAYTTAFEDSYPEYMTLYVPAEAINDYKTTAPWSAFGAIKTIEELEIPKCATPQIVYSNGTLSFDCETEGADFVTDIRCKDNNTYYNNSIDLTATYNISVYATADGHEISETVSATLCWIECGNNSETQIVSIPATAALITSAGGTVTVSCSLNGKAVAVYTLDGVLVGTATIENGTATIATGISKGTVAIVEIGEKSVKVVVG